MTAHTASQAAYVNGILGHSCEFDDAHALAWHTASAVVPAALALAERENAGGPEVITAVTAGIQVMSLLGVFGAAAPHRPGPPAGPGRKAAAPTVQGPAATAAPSPPRSVTRRRPVSLQMPPPPQPPAPFLPRRWLVRAHPAEDLRDRFPGDLQPGQPLLSPRQPLVQPRDLTAQLIHLLAGVDGLVTNASLISGLGGGGVSAHTVVLTGAASLVAGAFSMGTGEYISVTNQNELVGAEVSLEQRMLARFPAAEEEELAGCFRDYGADAETAARMAAAVSADPDTALQVHTRQELGMDPQDLPSPLLAGVSSLFAFSAGALVPLLPYLFGASVLWVTLALTAAALAAGGMSVGRLTGRPVLRSGLRQLAFGALAIAVTYLVGHLIGSSHA